MSIPYKCPVCLGCCIVPGGFYTATVGHIRDWTAGAATEMCRACNGSGIVWKRIHERDYC